MGRSNGPSGPPAGHGLETSTPEWNDTSETKGEKQEVLKKTSNMGEAWNDPTGPPSGHGPETSTPERNDTSETKGEKIGELASTNPCHLLSSLRERQRSRRFRAM